MDAKSQIRSQIRQALKQLSAEDRATASAKACALLQSQPAWQSAKSILFFAPLSDELDLTPAMRVALSSGKTVLLPRFSPQTDDFRACVVTDPQADLVPGAFGVREPSPACPEFPLNRLDFALVPGVAFGTDGQRLGRGKGYYDRLLGGFKGLKCGVAFDLQIVGGVPVEPHDIRLNCILTPSKWMSISGNRRQ